MIILELDWAAKGAGAELVLVFGCGLIGGEIVSALQDRGLTAAFKPFHWTDPIARSAHALAIQSQVAGLIGRCGLAGPKSVSVVWSAGRAGFAGQESELAAEYAAFESVLDLAERVWDAAPHSFRAFYLISSAGGLFEGQTDVCATSEPKPMRPYGVIKLLMEDRLKKWDVPHARAIFRPSTVYGVSRHKGRVGLPVALLFNGLQRRETRFFGQMDTLRDYVSNVDVGRFVAHTVIANRSENETLFLISGRPTSICEVKIRAETILGRKVYAVFEPGPANAANICFRASSMPSSLHSIGLEEGMRIVHRKLLIGHA